MYILFKIKTMVCSIKLLFLIGVGKYNWYKSANGQGGQFFSSFPLVFNMLTCPRPFNKLTGDFNIAS